MVNLLYNCADAVISTTLGEGWGLSITEAMATKTPIIAPDNTSLHEMMADGRGLLVPSGDSPSAWFSLGPQDNERVRPLMNVAKAADAVEDIINGTLPNIEAAYEWSRKNNWDNICERWIELFDNASDYAHNLNKSNQPNRAQRRAEAKRK